jgi:hypothetical protein
MDPTELRRVYAELQPGQRVTVVRRMQLGTRATESRSVGTLVAKQSRECGSDGGYRRAGDEKQWFNHLLLRKDDGELTLVALDEFTTLQTRD